MENQNLFKEYEGVFEAENAEENSSQEEEKEKFYRYNPFALQDAVGAKNAKNAWIEYQKIRFGGIEAEDVVHKIIGKVKDMSAILVGASKEDLGIKSDFPYNKSKRDLKNWREEELKNFYTKLVSIYHQSRMGAGPNDYSVGRGEDLDSALEKTLLTL